jgi:predicted dinucleotide-binding enzyme
MKIGVLGTGMVGAAIGSKLVQLGHEVKMGSRKAGNEKAVAWAAGAGKGASEGTFADAAAHGEIVFNCTRGTASVDAVKAAGQANLNGKILIDISVPLDLSKGFPPGITHHGEDSLGEQIQRALPGTKVVKTLNTVNCNVMVEPSRLSGEHDMFVCGDNPEAKARVTEILRDWFGWKSVIDLGDISTARGTEGYILMWLRLWGTVKSPDFNIKVVR